MEQAKIEALKKQVENFIKLARVENRPGVVCGDGGVPVRVKTTTSQTVQVAGMAGDLGQDTATIPAVLTYYRRHGIRYDLEEAVEKIVTANQKVHGVFQFHTSNHVHGDKITDCGDMNGKMMTERAERYQTNVAEIRQLTELLQKWYREEKRPGLEEQSLADREHQEAGVLLVTGQTHSLVHWLNNVDFPELPASEERMFFVLDPARAIARRQAVLEKLGFSSEAIAEIMRIKAEQDQATNSYLAVGKAVFAVDVDDEAAVKIEFKGIVQADGLVS